MLVEAEELARGLFYYIVLIFEFSLILAWIRKRGELQGRRMDVRDCEIDIADY